MHAAVFQCTARELSLSCMYPVLDHTSTINTTTTTATIILLAAVKSAVAYTCKLLLYLHVIIAMCTQMSCKYMCTRECVRIITVHNDTERKFVNPSCVCGIIHRYKSVLPACIQHACVHFRGSLLLLVVVS